MHSTIAHCLLASLLLLGAGCGDSTGNQNNNAQCPEGYEASGPACIPIFDDCPGAAEIPVLGGGCQQVGVTTCATGLFTSDGEGGCEPILPDHSCPPGTMEMLGQTECQPVGVTECAVGFEPDSEGGCNAILPPDPCPSGTIALLGYTTCQPLGDCGSGTWGNIVDDGTTVYVDQSADATGADGTQLTPLTTVGEALALVLPGGQIAVAAGDYTERLTINKEVRLTGRCAELVTIRGRYWLGEGQPPITITTGGTGTTVSSVTLTGPAEGLVINGAQQILVEQVQVRDASDMGIVVREEAEVTLQRMKVVGCTAMGILMRNSTLSVQQSVVQTTLAMPDTGLFGQGIGAACDVMGACGILHVDRSLVSGNRDVGINAMGVDATVTSSVVRDTLPRESDRKGGRGISAGCDPDTGVCGILHVARSLVSGNRYLGVATTGVDATVTSSVVRDTLSRESDQAGGAGIGVQCDRNFGVCGSLHVEGSLLSGNRYLGINAMGVDTTVTLSAVQDTLPSESDQAGGRGIDAECDVLYTGNCGILNVDRSLLSGNREVGVYAEGVETNVTSSVVRDTLPRESDRTGGRGIASHCDRGTGVYGSLRVSSCLVWGNRDVGIFAGGVDATVTSSVVRDTLPQDSDQAYGAGVVAQCQPTLGVCRILHVDGSVVSGNRHIGIYASGGDTEVSNTVVRDTLPEESTGMFGRGINAQCYPEAEVCGSLLVSSSLVVNNENGGIVIIGVPATLESVVVIDTQPNAQGWWRGIYGQGIFALCDDRTGDCGGLSMTSCLVDSSQSGGVAVEGVSGFMASSVVRSVSSQALDGKYGYGVQVGGLESVQLPTFDITDCQILNATLSGILYYRARGTISGSVVRGGENSVVMNEGSILTVLDNNDLSGTVENEPVWANLYPSPAPPPSLPLDPID